MNDQERDAILCLKIKAHFERLYNEIPDEPKRPPGDPLYQAWLNSLQNIWDIAQREAEKEL
jgi:hypothetical protein